MIGTDMQESIGRDEEFREQCRSYVRMHNKLATARATLCDLIGDRKVSIRVDGREFYLRRNLDNVLVTEIETI